MHHPHKPTTDVPSVIMPTTGQRMRNRDNEKCKAATVDMPSTAPVIDISFDRMLGIAKPPSKKDDHEIERRCRAQYAGAL